ncbi:uncharacterized protein [Henckelia pumila]|uniref:uncharacterized protein isoform X1 n=1 Tax=Henckelia pumila TaxID=405737 RepID=UPI003C6E6AC4
MIHTYSGSVFVLLIISALLAVILVKKFNINISWEYYWFIISSFIIPIYPLLDFKGLKVPAYTNLLGSIICPLALNVIKILSSYNKIKAGDLISFKDQQGELIIGKVGYVGLFSPLSISDCTLQTHTIFPEKMADACIVRLTVGSLKVIKFRLRVSRNDLKDTIRIVDDVVGECIEKDVKDVEKDGETRNVEEMEEISKEEPKKIDKNMGNRKFICVTDTDISSNSKNVEVIVSFLAKVDDLREYIRMKGDVMAKVSQLLAKAKGEFDERPMSMISRVDGA